MWHLLTRMGVRAVITNPTPFPARYRFLLDGAPGADKSREAVKHLERADAILVPDIADLPEDRQRLGFGLGGTPAGKLPITNEIYSSGYEELTLEGYADGYVILGKISDYTAVTPITDFITESNHSAAL